MPRPMPGDKERLRRRIHDADPDCHWCRRPVRLVAQVRGAATPDDMATLEHIVPECQGGHGESNMRLACFRCNSLRGCHPTLAEALLSHIGAARTRMAELAGESHPFRHFAIRKLRRRIEGHQSLLASIP